MRLEIDMPEHHYNNIMAFDSVSLGRVPYKGIIMYAINAIKHGRVLEQEPTTKNDLGVDAVSRKQAIEEADKLCLETGYDNEKVIEMLNELPSVTPIRPKGRWIDKQHLCGYCSAECSSCHKRSNGYVHDNGFSLEHKYYDFCPNCGAKMDEPRESEEWTDD